MRFAIGFERWRMLKDLRAKLSNNRRNIYKSKSPFRIR